MCEKIRRAMWPVHDTDFPIVGVAGNFRRWKRAGRKHHFYFVTPTQHVAGPKRTAGVAAEFAKNKCRSAVEICRHIESAAYGDVGPRTRVGCCTKLQCRARLYFHGLPMPYGLSIEHWTHIGASDRDN